MAFVVPKKLGPATFRNRLRRRMSESFRFAQKTAGSDAGGDNATQVRYDLIFLATPAASQATFTQLNEAFSQLMRRLNGEVIKSQHNLSRSGSRVFKPAPKIGAAVDATVAAKAESSVNSTRHVVCAESGQQHHAASVAAPVQGVGNAAVEQLQEEPVEESGAFGLG
ncbi:MAG: Ribonuclease [Abditibacteriota bacterium]|nr:Ribonuclease [Abditibacteriota bacterium]